MLIVIFCVLVCCSLVCSSMSLADYAVVKVTRSKPSFQ